MSVNRPMPKSIAEYVADFLLEAVPELLPKPLDAIGKGLTTALGDGVRSWLSEPRTRKELLDAARKAELEFRSRASETLGNDRLAQAWQAYRFMIRSFFNQCCGDYHSTWTRAFLKSTCGRSCVLTGRANLAKVSSDEDWPYTLTACESNC